MFVSPVPVYFFFFFKPEQKATFTGFFSWWQRQGIRTTGCWGTAAGGSCLAGLPCQPRSGVLLLLLGVLGRSPAQIIEIPSDTLSEQHIVTVLSLPSLLFIGEALPKIAFLFALSWRAVSHHPPFFFFLNILINWNPLEQPMLWGAPLI